jgi:ferredoxin
MPQQRLKIRVLVEDCIGDGACCDEAPGTFEISTAGVACVKQPVTDDPETVLRGARVCPTDAIVVTDDETDEQLVP